jgi:NAD(P)H dehydrogenase (quinone)
MKVLIVYWHPEPKSFNGAMFRTACKTLVAAGHEVRTSDLNETGFNPVSGRHNFVSVKDPFYFKQQIEELHATDHHGFAETGASEESNRSCMTLRRKQ